MTSQDSTKLRQTVYALLITVAAGAAAGRILAVELVLEPSLYRPEDKPAMKGRAWPPNPPPALPMFGSNDRSRWATIRALVDDGTYVIGRRERTLQVPSVISLLAAPNALEAVPLAAAGYKARVKDSDRGIIFEPGWESIDKVLKPDTQEYYSSKPPLLSTLVAGLYWLIKLLTGWTLADNPFPVVRTILFLVNWLPMVVYLKLLARLVEDYGGSDWARIFVVAAACFGTQVTPFLVTLNNHTVGTFAVLFGLYAALRIWALTAAGRPAPGYLFLLAGLFAAFAACNELPALAFMALLFLVLLRHAPRLTLSWFMAGGIVPLAAFLLTNYLAIGELRPAYDQFGGPWYEYEGSYWIPNPNRTGIDFAHLHESRLAYAFHVLLGHHGLFSLTPIWIIAAVGTMAGMGAWWRTRGNAAAWPLRLPAFVFVTTCLLSVVVIGFYLSRPDGQRNYGGWTSGLRWLMWLTPLWLLCMLPVLERLAAVRWGRALGYVALAISVLSASYPAWNPWRHPWLYRWMESLDWIPY